MRPIQIKAIEQYFNVMLFIMLYKVVLMFEPVNETLVCDHSNESYEQYFHVVLFVMLYNLVLTVRSVAQTPVCDH